jgi:hypothetical protein
MLSITSALPAGGYPVRLRRRKAQLEGGVGELAVPPQELVEAVSLAGLDFAAEQEYRKLA